MTQNGKSPCSGCQRTYMKREDVQRHLERGKWLGWGEPVEDPLYWRAIEIGWRPLPSHALELLNDAEFESVVGQSKTDDLCQYTVIVAEIRRGVALGLRHAEPKDYREYKVHRFATLEAVERFAHSFGRTLEDLTWAADIYEPS